jgi:hypothetical protein
VKFEAALDDLTLELIAAVKQVKWGAARKFLNIFLRDASCNYFLRRHHGLENVERYLELPLDSHVATWLRRKAKKGHFRSWKSVISVDRELNRKYQIFAQSVADEMGLARVHLDLYAWRSDGA